MHYVVLDLETLRSADDCRHCGREESLHYHGGACEEWTGERPPDTVQQFSGIGWDNKAALGLSIGCYWDSATRGITFFDEDTLEDTITHLVNSHPLLVSFNGIRFDGPLMRGILRRRAETMGNAEEQCRLTTLCNTFQSQWAFSYDILAEIWKLSPANKFTRGLNSLDAIAQANGLGAKLSHGAQAPRDWAAGKWARVINYCQDDVYKTQALFRMACAGEPIKQSDGSALVLPIPQDMQSYASPTTDL